MANDANDGSILRALSAAMARIDYSPEGRILNVNDGYLELLDYRLDEVRGKPHQMLLGHSDTLEAGYRELWDSLRAGHGRTGHFKRIGRSGRAVRVLAVFCPITDESDQVARIAEFAIDVTESDRAAANAINLINAFTRSHAVMEFTPTGEILTANDAFLRIFGYRLDEVRGQPHRILVAPDEAASADDQRFWDALSRGEAASGEYRRIARDGQILHIVATYAPVRDAAGDIIRVVKFATDVTENQVALETLIAGIDRLAAGDLTTSIQQALPAEFAVVRDVFNASIEGLAVTIDALRERATAMQAEAGSIAEGAEDLARRGETQAASLEETAAAVEQISGNISVTSESAREADGSAREAKRIVDSGAEVVAQTIAAMERIERHTRAMAEFTRVIENFAFQTNLLSINAAVEAARAGEVGRGFAVVANEVRNLAQQSSKASQSIAELISKSENEVRSGVTLVKDAGCALEQISGAVAAMASSVAGIAHATTEQAAGVREISESLSQLDMVNQSNLGLSSSNAAAAASLSSQVREMTAQIEHFSTAAKSGPNTVSATPPVRLDRYQPAPVRAGAR